MLRARLALLALCALSAAVESSESSEADSALYEAYNQLHTLSQQVLGKVIESPAVVVMGRQTDGKSALIEALMGFQFNHVGGGTKTRKPIALQMQYDPTCEEPTCYLATGDGEQRVTLRLLPAKGMTLPFISYGGSSMLAVALGMGMLLALTRKRPQDHVTDMIGGR